MNISKHIIAIIGCFWLLVTLNTLIVWNSFENFIRLFAALLMIGATIYLNLKRKLIISPSALYIAFCVLLFYFWLTVRMDDSIGGFIIRASGFIPLILVLFWQRNYICDIYTLFRKCMMIVACGSTCVSLLSLLGLLSYIPYIEYPAQSALHESWGAVYYAYGGFFVIMSGSGLLPRACGIFQEPGHYAIILGFVYLIDKFANNKRNIIVVLSGILTFSANFIIIAIIAEIYSALAKKQILKFSRYVAGVLLSIIVIYFLLPKNLQDEVMHLAYERNLKIVIEVLKDSGSLAAALDERSNSTGDFYYSSLSESEKIIGAPPRDEDIVLSDYRGLILNLGYIGLVILIIAVFATTKQTQLLVRGSIVAVLTLVLLHRSWMYYAPYLFFIAYMGATVYRNSDNINTQK